MKTKAPSAPAVRLHGIQITPGCGATAAVIRSINHSGQPFLRGGIALVKAGANQRGRRFPFLSGERKGCKARVGES